MNSIVKLQVTGRRVPLRLVAYGATDATRILRQLAGEIEESIRAAN
jgi:hypothetical protein